MADRELEGEIDAGLAELGFELVELERAGSAKRPVLRLRIDREPGDDAEAGISIDDCVRVSRVLEARLESRTGIPESYTLEVSSPGVERPLVRRRDFERFAGREVAVRGKGVLADRAKRLEGELVGIRGEDGDEVIILRLGTGEVIEVPRAEVTRANLIFRWGSEGRRT